MAKQEEGLVEIQPAAPVVVTDDDVVKRGHPVGSPLRIHVGAPPHQGLADGHEVIPPSGRSGPDVHDRIALVIRPLHVSLHVQKQAHHLGALGLHDGTEDDVRSPAGALVDVALAPQELLDLLEVAPRDRVEEGLGPLLLLQQHGHGPRRADAWHEGARRQEAGHHGSLGGGNATPTGTEGAEGQRCWHGWDVPSWRTLVARPPAGRQREGR
mmetsp:Transcript_106384/g.343180  ORF Transcript_106384/g.343180 Transcript_106384/m.343180 type:complete len:212 (+) Transcript_106384:241-876(+)